MNAFRLTRTVLLFASIAVVPFAVSADSEFTFRSNAAEVRLTLTAADKERRFVADLSPSEFAIVDNENVVRRFRSFSRVQENRLNVLIVLDKTESVSPRLHQESHRWLEYLENADWGADDRVSVLSLDSSHPSWHCLRNCSSSEFGDRVERLRTGGLTPLFDALAIAIEAASNETTRRSALLVFSDGEDNYSMSSAGQVITAAQRSETPIYTVGLDGDDYSRGSRTLRQISESTGGHNLPADQTVLSILTGVTADLRNAYVVTYVPPEPTPGRHTIRVLPARNLSLTLRSRDSYFYDLNPER